LTQERKLSAYFISDAHLGRSNPEIEARKQKYLTEFLREVVQNGNYLFIVGDLFDFWFEWRWVIPKDAFSVLAELKSLVDCGVQVHYLAGNHDFALTGFLETEIGLAVHADDLDFTLDGRRFFIYHGDGLLSRDRGYRLLKKIIRHPWSVALYRLLHPDLGIAIARLTSRMSQDHLSLKYSEKDEAESEEFARKKLQTGFNAVILAHSHNPQIKQFPEGIYVNLGEWMREFTFAIWDGERLSLRQWPDKIERT
jgi:UDP-2,3-diacylglucosamine hydrolase